MGLSEVGSILGLLFFLFKAFIYFFKTCIKSEFSANKKLTKFYFYRNYIKIVYIFQTGTSKCRSSDK
jgi:hypothetical protein